MTDLLDVPDPDKKINEIVNEAIKEKQAEIEEKKKTLAKTAREEVFLEKKRSVRSEQIKMLNQRLKKGWADEKAASDA